MDYSFVFIESVPRHEEINRQNFLTFGKIDRRQKKNILHRDVSAADLIRVLNTMEQVLASLDTSTPRFRASVAAQLVEHWSNRFKGHEFKTQRSQAEKFGVDLAMKSIPTLIPLNNSEGVVN